MKMKKSLLATFLVGLCINAFGQQDPHYTQYMFNKQLYNPAYTGFTNSHCVALLMRSQYGNYLDQTYTLNQAATGAQEVYGKKGSRTATFSYGAPIPFAEGGKWKSKNTGGIGASFFSDRVGYVTTTNFKLDISGKRELDPDRTIAVGLNIGAVQKELDFSGFLPKDPGDPLIPVSTATSNMKPAIGFGAWYRDLGMHDLNIGYSLQNINKPQFNAGPIVNMRAGLHHYIFGSAVFALGPLLELTPSLMVKASQDQGFFANPDFNTAALFKYNNNLTGGIALRNSFKTFESASVVLGYNLNPELRIGYSFDFNVTALSRNNSNTHEIILNYCFKLKIPEPTYLIIVDPLRLGKDPNQE